MLFGRPLVYNYTSQKGLGLGLGLGLEIKVLVLKKS